MTRTSHYKEGIYIKGDLDRDIFLMVKHLTKNFKVKPNYIQLITVEQVFHQKIPYKYVHGQYGSTDTPAAFKMVAILSL